MKDLVNQRFGRWTVIAFSHNVLRSDGKRLRPFWLCRCEDGVERAVMEQSLLNGTSRSCGCLNAEVAAAIGKRTTTHGLSSHPIYHVYKNMIKRCGDPKNSHFDSYGGRGIKVCDAWQTFEAFADDMYGTYVSGLTLERKDNNADYSKGNCVWATSEVQQNNKRTNVFCEYNGERLTIQQWARRCGIPNSTLYNRIVVNKWPIERALVKGSYPSKKASIANSEMGAKAIMPRESINQ